MANSAISIAQLFGGAGPPPPMAELLRQMPRGELLRELLRIVSMSEAARLSSLSEDTLERDYADLIVHLSRRRKGMRVKDALMIRP